MPPHLGRAAAEAAGRAFDHAEAGADLLEAEGLPREVAWAVRRHNLTAIIRPDRRPVTWLDKLVYYADKVYGNSFVPLEERLADVGRRYPSIGPELPIIVPAARELEEEILAAAHHDGARGRSMPG